MSIITLSTAADSVDSPQVGCSIVIMNNFVEQRVCVKFRVSCGTSYAESLKMLSEIYGDSVLSKTEVYEWYKAFKSGRQDVNDLPRASIQERL
ncbi:HTH domain in Mos1 transposase [Popillia japonica]|uniref:HTH domain in Mos1 transposase n=1 Tax=Popillia japonica TaxID=7064 RepID=A0AAW1LC21_POPJA